MLTTNARSQFKASALALFCAVSLFGCAGDDINDTEAEFTNTNPEITITAPTPFSFDSDRFVAPSTATVSNPAIVQGFPGQLPISVTGGEYSLNSESDFTSAQGMVTANDMVRVRVTSPAAESESATVSLVVGSATPVTFTVTSVLTGSSGQQKLGINFNEQVIFVEQGSPVEQNLADLEPEWIRGFIDYFEIFDSANPDQALATTDRIGNMLALADDGYKVAFSIKFNYAADDPNGNDRDFPTPESDEMANVKANLTKLYDRIWSKTSLLVVGNEPFIETEARQGNDPALAPFYKELTDFTIAYRATQNRYVPIYVGAFNRINEANWQNDASLAMFQYAEETPGVAGVDLHIHHNSYDALTDSMAFASSRIRADQKIISTEFSSMRYWKSHLRDDLSAEFVAKYPEHQKVDETTMMMVPEKVYEYLDKILKVDGVTSAAVSREQWLDFVNMNAWYLERQDYLEQAYTRFAADPKFFIGFYAFRQSYSFTEAFTATTDPWILNAIYVNRTVELIDGSYQLNANFHNDFAKYR